ncbi:asparagine--tRNA ligase [Spiroplasma endosymbiont of Crioceris asparagi]|uniref:asparagine--tRNA ligase n=1 Tax=Spiroplasma endosymbiont of Crioceris asparagi TaxID=3066286 RepID=UPI0030D043F1
MLVRELLKNFQELANKEVEFTGRIRSNRQGKNVSFLVLNDGSVIDDVQVVYKNETKNFEQLSKQRLGAVVYIQGKLVPTPNRPQPFEIQAKISEIISECAEEYPLQKKEQSLEFLREIPQLRPRTKTFQAVFKIRSLLSFAIHKFFNEKDFVYVNTPIITENDAEGAGEAFVVTTRNDGKYEDDFFGKKANLTVSGQLNAEAYAQSLNSVYTFGPTFRAENSNTSRHAAEFWMIEPEVALNSLKENIDLIEELIKSVLSYVLENGRKELEACQNFFDDKLISRLESAKDSKFKVLDYAEAINILKEAVKKNKNEFEEKNIKFGLDLGSEHEKYLCEKHFGSPVFLINYPKEIKAFYMKLNDDKKTVAAVDLLVPGIGELVGGSQREDNFDKLILRSKELGINFDDLSWYFNLRKFGYYKSSGFGLGFERLVMYVTGATNIRDVISFPRTPNNLLF